MYMMEEKQAVLERIQREKRNAQVCGDAEKAWVTLFRQYENIEEINRRVLMALVDKILIYENHAMEVVFRYRDEYSRLVEFVQDHAELLPQMA